MRIGSLLVFCRYQNYNKNKCYISLKFSDLFIYGAQRGLRINIHISYFTHISQLFSFQTRHSILIKSRPINDRKKIWLTLGNQKRWSTYLPTYEKMNSCTNTDTSERLEKGELKNCAFYKQNHLHRYASSRPSHKIPKIWEYIYNVTIIQDNIRDLKRFCLRNIMYTHNTHMH